MLARPVERMITVVLVIGLLQTRIADAQTSQDERIDDFVRAEMERQRVPGVAIGIVRNGDTIKARGYGYANLEHRVSVNVDTIFQSGSLGKQFTATLIMLLVEDGKLALTDPLTKFFPAAPDTWRSITVYHLLTHTSGIPDYADGKLDYRKDYTEDQLAQLAAGLLLEFPPGSKWHYSNTGYVLLGIIIKKVSNQFHGDVLTQRVLERVGMKTARIISEADLIPNRAAGYRLADGVLKNQEWVSPTLNTTADGCLYFSVRDMIAWDLAIRARAVLEPESWSRMFQPVRLNNGESYPYGFGWFLHTRGGHPLHHHRGSWQGFMAQFSRFIGDDLSIIVLLNLAEADPMTFANGIAAIINPKLAEASKAKP
jgi:CubicO group peptidase (beta-lactamase class C family)